MRFNIAEERERIYKEGAEGMEFTARTARKE
jgi:hypothetical protein